MESLKMCSLPTNRARRMLTASNDGVLPLDALFDILLRLPAKELCRLRAVCRTWRALTYDPFFIQAHTTHHQGPLLLAKFEDDEAHINIMDLSGNLVKRIDNPDGHQLLCTQLDLACVATESNRCRVLNPATGAVYVLPESPAAEHLNRKHVRDPYTLFAFGRVASTGEYKVFRMFNRPDYDGFQQRQLCEVFTINGGTSCTRWRARQSRDIFVEVNSAVVVDGVVHFLMDDVYDHLRLSNVHFGVDPDCVASFDLGTEEWRRDIQGPISSSFDMDNDDYMEYLSIWHRLTLAELKCSLVLVYYRPDQFIMDLWFLTDLDNGLWEKRYSIQTEPTIPDPANGYRVKPLLVLDDGRLVIFLAPTGLLLICDPVADTFAEVEMRHLDSVGVYTGSLLSL
uniref:Uncharacterized protein n=1 Tax=Arundo donax TaxID=35708 RepID=A0A0A9AGM9_ARUDO